MDRDALDKELIRDEGEKLYAYDDFDSSPIKSGTTVRGTVTAGVGCNLSFLYPEESRFLLHNREDKAITEVSQALPEFETFDDVRQRALANLRFNVNFLRWPNFMGFLIRQDWDGAATELENTHPYVDQVGSRALRIAQMLRTGAA